MKKRMTLLILLLLFGMGSTVLATEVNISTAIPAWHTVTVEAQGGRIVADSMVCGSSVQIARQKLQTWWIIPNQGKELNCLYYNFPNR